MKAKQKNLSAVVLLVLLVIGCLLQYNNYIQRQIYYESTRNLLETYEQVDKTILMFAQRNWNVLSDWGSYLHEITEDEDIRKWRDFGEEKRTWNYSDFYMVNEDGAYWTVDGRSGTADHIEKAFQVLYEKNQPVVSSYHDMLNQMNQRYLVLTDGENAKMSQVLTPEQIQHQLQKKDDLMRIEYCTRDKSLYLVMYVIPVIWEEGKVTQVIFISQDIGRVHELENLANTDGLTGLFNSRYFSRVLQLKEEKRQRFTLFYLDLDRFKPINDTYGHDVGDKLLREVAVRLQGCIRTSDYAFRIGGDEFALIVNETLEKRAREERVALIRKTILTPFDIDGNRLCVETSCGCASYPEEAAHTEDIRIIADQRMYEDKEKNHAGR